MNIPAELKYTKDHEWVRVEGDVAVVGVTDYAQGELGDIVYIEIETEGDNLDQEEVFGTVEAVKTVSDLFMPISGEIVEVNSSVEFKTVVELPPKTIPKVDVPPPPTCPLAVVTVFAVDQEVPLYNSVFDTTVLGGEFLPVIAIAAV